MKLLAFVLFYFLILTQSDGQWNRNSSLIADVRMVHSVFPIFNVSNGQNWFVFNFYNLKISDAKDFCSRINAKVLSIQSPSKCTLVQSAIHFFLNTTYKAQTSFWLIRDEEADEDGGCLAIDDIDSSDDFCLRGLMTTPCECNRMTICESKNTLQIIYAAPLQNVTTSPTTAFISSKPTVIATTAAKTTDVFSVRHLTTSHTGSLSPTLSAGTTGTTRSSKTKSINTTTELPSTAQTSTTQDARKSIKISTTTPSTPFITTTIADISEVELSELQRVGFEVLNQQNLSQSDVEELTEVIKKVTGNSSNLYDVNNVDMVVDLLQNLSSVTTNVTVSAFTNILVIANNIHDAEESIRLVTQTSKSRLTRAIEMFTNGVELPDNESNLEIVTQALAVGIQKVLPSDDVVFFDASHFANRTNQGSASFKLPLSTRNANSSIRVSYILYEDDVYFSSPFHAEKVISVLLPDPNASHFLQVEPFQYSTPLLAANSSQQYRFLSCSYWDEDNLEWSNRGCVLRESDSANPLCECNHLSNFALVVRIHYIPSDLGLDLLGKIGCSLSVMGFFLTAFLYLIFKELRTSKPGPIHIQLCLCLGIAYLIFLSGSGMIHNSLLCIGMTASMHYFLLAAWVWMFVEGLAMFKTLVKKSRFLGNDFLLKWSIVAYVLPACTVAVTMGITIGVLDKEREWYLDPDNTAIVESNYVHDNFCWLHGSALILGFLAELGFIFAVNVIIYGAVIRSITWGRKKIQSSHAPPSTKDHVIKVTSVAALLGVTWIFSIPLFQTRDETTIIVFSYIFSFFNSFQGVAIFLLFCVRNPKTRALWLNPIKSKMKYLELRKRRSYMIPSV